MSKYQNNKINKELNNSWNNIINLVNEGERVLDVGCSSGYLAKELVDNKNVKVWGIDIDESDIQEAKKVCEDAVAYDIEDPKWVEHYKEKFFDTIIYADILEHLRNPYKVLELSRNLLKLNGQILVSVPNIAHSSVRLNLLKGEFNSQRQGVMDNTHLQYFTKKKIVELITSAGFEVVKVIPIIINQIPRKIILDNLNALGLNPTEEALKYFDTEEANAYQYLVQAKNINKPAKEIEYPVLTGVQIEADDYINQVNDLVHRQQAELEKQDQVLRNKDKQLKEYEENINARDEIIKKYKEDTQHLMEALESLKSYKVLKFLNIIWSHGKKDKK